MKISMDKYKTSELGQALKKVFHGEITVSDGVELAEKEISEVFDREKTESTGFFGQKIGVCPICGKDVVKGKYSFGCTGYKDGCAFRINKTILGTTLLLSDAVKLLTDGITDKMSFTSKKGKAFDAKLKLDKENKIVFDFS